MQNDNQVIRRVAYVGGQLLDTVLVDVAVDFDGPGLQSHARVCSPPRRGWLAATPSAMEVQQRPLSLRSRPKARMLQSRLRWHFAGQGAKAGQQHDSERPRSKVSQHSNIHSHLCSPSTAVNARLYVMSTTYDDFYLRIHTYRRNELLNVELF
jgi:hypothetical protein